MNAKKSSFGKTFLSKRRFALVEIAIVLCSMLLVAIPAIAADQNQEMQKTSASEVTTASEDDYTLGIYGNANEDDTIDMRDTTYIKLVIFGKKPKTDLADANNDGKVSMLDVGQTKLIILDKERELTIVDDADRIVTVKKPVERVIICETAYSTEVVRMLGKQDTIVGVDFYTEQREVYFPELSKLPSIGSPPDAETILSYHPDLVFTWSYYLPNIDVLQDDIPLVCLHFYQSTDFEGKIMKVGYILGEKERAEEFNNDFYGKYLNLIKERTAGLSEEEKPKVYSESFMGDYRTSGGIDRCSVLGCRNIFAGVTGSFSEVDPEEVAAKNPNIIVKSVSRGYSGATKFDYETDDPSELEAVWENIMSRPELGEVEAVKTGKVYIRHAHLHGSLHQPVGYAYMAKWFHPDLFEDLDPQAIHQELIDRFCPGLDFDVYKHGVFVYHPEEHPDGG